MKIYHFKKSIYTVSLGIFLFFFVSCDKFLHIAPPIDQISPELAFSNDDSAKSTITGIYSRMVFGNGFASGDVLSVTSIAGMCADELNSNNSQYDDFFYNSLVPTGSATGLWNATYQYIYSANAVLERLNKSSNVSAAVSKQLKGEAKFIRAFCYFYLINFFGDVPLHLTSDYVVNTSSIRAHRDLVYQQITKDLIEAKALLETEYYTSERVRPNRWVVTALLARVYLYTNKWTEAEALASSVIDNPLFELQNNLDNVFLKNSKEAIWKLMPNRPGLNTNEGNVFIITTAANSVSLTTHLVDSFEAGDKRRSSWIGDVNIKGITYYFPYKYKVSSSASLTEYSMVFRLAEQYLIRAEARIRLNRIDQGIGDLNILRERARALVTTDSPNPLPALSLKLSKNDALQAVEQERKIELFSEWGHRWLDLKRTNRSETILFPIKKANWQNTDVLFPIPQTERNANPLITQNDGY